MVSWRQRSPESGRQLPPILSHHPLACTNRCPAGNPRGLGIPARNWTGCCPASIHNEGPRGCHRHECTAVTTDSGSACRSDTSVPDWRCRHGVVPACQASAVTRLLREIVFEGRFHGGLLPASPVRRLHESRSFISLGNEVRMRSANGHSASANYGSATGEAPTGVRSRCSVRNSNAR